MSTTATRPSDAPRASTVSPLPLFVMHLRMLVIETLRVPIAVIGTMAFPALSLLFFVVPNRAVADDPVLATQAVLGLAVFAVMVSALFNLGLTVAENREKPWDPYLRSLPLPAAVRISAQVSSTAVFSFLALVPVLVVGALATAAQVSAIGLLSGLVVLAVTSIPFLLLGAAIGYAFSSKAAIAVIQVGMFGFAFGGGLFFPPQFFPEWLEMLSRFFPSRHARELTLAAVEGTNPELWMLAGAIIWTLGTAALALWLYRRDEGRRYR
ncbi:MAG: ABC transporter permease [Microcella sp.]